MEKYDTYKICVTARGMTSDIVQRADDLLDAIDKARELQRRNTRRIEIILLKDGDFPDYPYGA